MPEVTSCPSCARQLRVPDSLLGKAVKCPSCGTNFTAGGSATVPTHQAPPPPPPPQYQPPPRTGGYEEPPPQDEPDDQDYEDSPRRSRRRRSRRSRGSRGAPHRGGLILALGIIGLAMLFVCALLTLPLCLPAWLMGNRDLRQMEDGYMDQDGEGITQAGRICGLIGTIIGGLVYLAVCFYIMFVIVIVAGQGIR